MALGLGGSGGIGAKVAVVVIGLDGSGGGGAR